MAITTDLLLHWWQYYGKKSYTFDELEAFKKIIDERGAERVLDVVVYAYVLDDGSPTAILMSIQNNTVDDLFDSLPNIADMEQEQKAAYEALREKFVQAISRTA